MSEPVLTVKEAAAQYFHGKVSARQVYQLFDRRELIGYRVGAKILIYKSSLDDYVQRNENRKPEPILQQSVNLKQPAGKRPGGLRFLTLAAGQTLPSPD